MAKVMRAAMRRFRFGSLVWRLDPYKKDKVTNTGIRQIRRIVILLGVVIENDE